jgi:hypothetical protein
MLAERDTIYFSVMDYGNHSQTTTHMLVEQPKRNIAEYTHWQLMLSGTNDFMQCVS